MSQAPLCLSLIGFRPHCHLQSFTLITSANTLFPNEVTLTIQEDMDWGAWGWRRHHSSHRISVSRGAGLCKGVRKGSQRESPGLGLCLDLDQRIDLPALQVLDPENAGQELKHRAAVKLE